MPVELGAVAPDFDLPDQYGQRRRLSALRGRNVLLVFFPLAFSGLCAGELCELRDDLPSFVNEYTATLAVSVDSPYAARVFAEQEGYTFPLLSDFWPHGEVAGSYGVFNSERGFANRASFIIDRDGVVRYALVNRPGEPRDADEYRRVLAGLAPRPTAAICSTA
jgi:peroxiredoxin